MPVRRDRRTNRWYFRTTVKLLDGTSRRVFGTPGVPGQYADLAPTRVGAAEAERRAIAEIMSGASAEPVRPAQRKEMPTFEEFTQVYMEKMRFKGNKRGPNKPATLNAKESHLRIHLLPRFGPKRLDQIDSEAIEELMLALGKKGRSMKTINNVLTTLHNILANAKKKYLRELPTIEWYRIENQPFDFFDFEEAERLLVGASKVPEWHCAVLLAVKTGLRLGELRALRGIDVDLRAGKLTVARNLWRNHEGTPKTGKTRTLDLPASAVAALKEHQHLRGPRVFLDGTGAGYTLGAWRWGLYRACRRAGLREVGWHVLRHTFASHLVMRGESLKVVQELMGHSTIHMTLKYAHLAPGATRAAVTKLDEPAPSWARRGSHVAAEMKSAAN
jgi:integrase